MTHAIPFDTLAYAKKLKIAGVNEKQAEAQAETLAEIFDDQIATKQDIEGLRTATKQDFEEFRIVTKQDAVVFEAEINTKLANLKIEIIKWMISMLTIQSATLISCIKLLH